MKTIHRATFPSRLGVRALATPRHLLATALAALAVACSVGLGAGCGGTYADKCALACTPKADTPCADEDTAACEDDCEVATEGLSVECAQCIVEHSGWSGVACDSQGCLGAFGPNGAAVDCEPCTSADEHCTKFKLAKTTDYACKSVCGAGG